MISEIRRVMFSAEALTDIIDFARQRGATQRLPPGVIEEITLQDPQAPKVTVRINVLGGGKIQTVTLPQSELAAILILYCRSRKIPLPRQGSKSFEIVQANLCLTMRLQHAID
jgi:hypothetical protein